MKKMLLFLLTATIIALMLTACGDNPAKTEILQSTAVVGQDNASDQVNAPDEAESSESETDTLQTTDKHYYKTVRIIGYADAMMPSITGVMENIFGFGEYLPTITFHYNTESGMAESAEYSTYYSYSPYEDNEFLQSDMEVLSSGEGEFLSRFSNLRTEDMEAEGVTKLTFDMDISTYFSYLYPEINLYFVTGEQNIEDYKDAIYYSRVDGYYDPKPTCEEGENYFYDQISCIRIEWAD